MLRPAPAAEPGKSLPTVKLRDKQVTRLIAGGNPIAGFSHATPRLDNLMRQYFTVERTTEFIRHLEEEGIDTWQCSYQVVGRDALRAARERGSKIQYICLSADRPTVRFQDVLDTKPIAIVHHGSDTDRLMQAGQHQKIHDYVKRVQDAGIIAGISTHHPEYLARFEDYGWSHEFYMSCCYNLTRDPEEVRAKLGDVTVDEMFLRNDPAKMLARVREVKRPCLAFKILAAGRVCQTKATVEKAFQFAYANIKPTDAVIVGMFPVLHDEVREDAEFARKYA
jgi:hypothetical protein